MNEKIQDTQQLLVSYEALESQGATLEEKIEVLKALKETSKVEEWSYRLAETYDKAGMKKECVNQCDELLLWYNNGTYTKAALELKKKYDALTPLQQMKYDELMEKEQESMTDRLPNLESYIHRNIKESSKAKEPVAKVNQEIQEKVPTEPQETYIKPDVVEMTLPEEELRATINTLVQEQLPGMLDTALQEQLPGMLTSIMKKQLPSILKKALKGSVTVPVKEEPEPEPKQTVTEQTKCFLLVGPRGTYTSKEAVKAIKSLLQNCGIQGKLVKITATKMTEKKLQTVSQMEDLGVVVIENAAELPSDMAKALNETLEQGMTSGLVVLAEEKEALREFLIKNHELRGKFTSGVRY